MILDADPDLFFPTSYGSGTKNDHPDWTAPRAICARCTVIGPCLEDALASGPAAGMSPSAKSGKAHHLFIGLGSQEAFHQIIDFFHEDSC